MVKANPGHCIPCNSVIAGNNWARHLLSKAHLARSKGKMVKKIVVNAIPTAKRGRPITNNKLHSLDTRAMVAHVRARGMELYYWKASKVSDDL